MRSISIRNIVVIIFALATLVMTAVGQGTKAINGGVLNGKAVSLPKPVYPEVAKAAGISGVIGVNIIIDETGNVASAEAEINDLRERRDVDGTKLDPLPADPSLRAAAEEAARNARFLPVVLNGEPRRVSGKIVYNFVSGENGLTEPPLDLKIIRGGVLNGKALALPKPEYPAAAKAVKAQGAVSVQITVDEQGNVISASAVSGHPLLRSAAETAARGATFSPTLLSGQAVKFSGIVTYNFVLPTVEGK